MQTHPGRIFTLEAPSNRVTLQTHAYEIANETRHANDYGVITIISNAKHTSAVRRVAITRSRIDIASPLSTFKLAANRLYWSKLHVHVLLSKSFIIVSLEYKFIDIP